MFNIIDTVIIGCLTIGLITGFFSGFIKQAISLGGLLIAIYFSNILANWVGELLLPVLDVPEIAYKPVFYVAAFLLIFVGCKSLSFVLTQVAETMGLNFINRLAGMLLGGIKTALVISLIITLLESFDKNNKWIDKELRQEAKLYNPIKKVGDTLFPFFVESVAKQSPL